MDENIWALVDFVHFTHRLILFMIVYFLQSQINLFWINWIEARTVFALKLLLFLQVSH